jgi:hypothetical protein
MSVLVEYRCPGCGSAAERFVQSPPAVEVLCAGCGGMARRAWGPPSVTGRARQPSLEPSSASKGPICLTNQDIPGLCMFSPTAARSLVARVRKDNRSLDKELAYQEHMQKDAPGALTVGEHGCGHSIGDGHEPSKSGKSAEPVSGSAPTSSPTAETTHNH